MSPDRRGPEQPGVPPRAGSRAPSAEPALEGLYAELLHAFAPLARETDPMAVELATSDVLGSWWNRLPPGEDPDRLVGLGAVGYAARCRTPEALALLRALAAVASAETVRSAAAEAAATLAGSGVAEPPWSATIGRVRQGDCWRLGDVYGDQASLLCEFGYGGRRHGVVALLDFNHLSGWVKDVLVTDEPARVLRALRAAASSEPLTTLEQVDPVQARRLLEDGFAATDMTWLPDVGEEFRRFRALALARCRAMPPPDRPARPEPAPGEADREAIVEEFLSSPHGRALPDAEAARLGAWLLVDFGADHDGGRPLRVSPAKTEAFLHDWVPRRAALDPAAVAAIPPVVLAWVRWAGARAGLPPAALDEVVAVATECGGHFAQAYEDGAAAPALLLEGMDAAIGPEELRAAVARRLAALPARAAPAAAGGKATAPGSPERPGAAAGARPATAVYQVKVTLRGSKPPIWRRLRLPAGTTLRQLHEVIQVAFGWTGAHLHSFDTAGRAFADPASELEGAGDERRASLLQVAPAAGARLGYTYDFGDGWEHDIAVEKVLPPDGVRHAVCVTGRRAGPPEDCGGVQGHQALCEVLADPGHPEHADRLEWLGAPYDPAAFARDDVNGRLARMPLG
ncbi:MAG TPA: plasmid pRiA4b ORF-3 family protein [Actinomycetes bacterium]|nr:plasmid pRiA4b ORF-3 family protein [Actinomycetes bacterium]